jgi:ABC-type transporter MlaC component
MMNLLLRFFLAISLALGLSSAWAADEAPDAFVKRITNETLDAVRTDKSIKAGDINKIMQLVDTKLMQHVNFRRMTALATGPAWRKATPEQQERLQEEFKLLLIRTYSGALSQINDQTIDVKPLRGASDDKNLVVQTEVKGKKATLFNWTTALKKRLAKVLAGRFLTSMSWAFGWLKTTAPSFPKKSMPAAWTA